MPRQLQGTMSGNGLSTDFNSAGMELPPEVLEAARQLLAISSAPTPGEQASAQSATQSAFGPLQQQLASQQAPADAAMPEQAGPLGSFLGMLSANLAGQVNPALARPTYDILEEQRNEARKIGEFNREQHAAFNRDHSTKELELAMTMTEQSLKMAQNAGDDRATTQKALQTEKIRDALAARRDKIEQQAQMDREILQQKGETDRTKIREKGDTARASMRETGENARQTISDKNARERALIGAGIDPATNQPYPQGMGKGERAAALRQGMDPVTKRKLAVVADREVREASKILRNKKLKVEQAALTVQNIHQIQSQRWDIDKTENEMVARLLRAQHPLYPVAPNKRRYLITEEPMYKNGKFDDAAAQRAAAVAEGLAQPWFEENE